MRACGIARRAALIAGIIATLLVSAAAAAAATATSSPTAYASQLVQFLNQAREQSGVPALTLAAGTAEVAQGWSGHLAAAGSLSHNPNLVAELSSHGSANWHAIGENVGTGPSDDPRALFDAYMNSTPHRENILNVRYRFLGVGVVFSDGRAWNTLDFVDSYSPVGAGAAVPDSKPTLTVAPKALASTSSSTSGTDRSALRPPPPLAPRAAVGHQEATSIAAALPRSDALERLHRAFEVRLASLEGATLLSPAPRSSPWPKLAAGLLVFASGIATLSELLARRRSRPVLAPAPVFLTPEAQQVVARAGSSSPHPRGVLVTRSAGTAVDRLRRTDDRAAAA